MTPSLQITSLRLRVANLSRSIEFYSGLGFVAHGESLHSVQFATAVDLPPLLTLVAGGTRAPHDAAGLFHVALLFPSRAALGGWLKAAASGPMEFDGFSDHGVSEAIYFSDPDGNGLEFYADRPRDLWPRAHGQLVMVTRPLDTRSLLDAADRQEALLADTAWGHLHLRVTDLDRSEAFYGSVLGLEVTQSTYPGARFLATDDYHHHLGLNIWGNPRSAQPEGAIGLDEASFAHAGATAGRLLRDPDGINLRIEPLRVAVHRE